MYPVADERWIPNPLKYRDLDLEPAFLDRLKDFDERTGTHFKTRLLLLQSFIDESALGDDQEAKLLSNSRLVPLGRRVMMLSLTSFLFQNYPQINTQKSRIIHNSVMQPPAFQLLGRNLYPEFDQLVLANNENEDLPYIRQKALLSTIGALYLDQGIMKSLAFVFGPLREAGMEKLISTHFEGQKE